jgi:UDP-4-amino-4-deoxy-L-arabinose formyltransferase/UDP-glucuronic acid dehydrogenase (UDP-4-keto-hexauronic acid decarboxylating)
MARLKILLAAEESAGIHVLRKLLASEHTVAGVLTGAPPTKTAATVRTLAEQHGLEVLPPTMVKDPALAERIRAEAVDLLLNIHSLFIIDPAVVSAPRIGSFNLHPGPLPEYAGLNVPSWALYNGETEHGVSLHWMEAGVDTGAVAYAARFPLSPTDTGLSVTSACVRQGLPLVDQLLDDASTSPSEIPALPQDLTRRRVYGRQPPDEGILDWRRPSRQVVDFVRAANYAPFPSPWGHPRTVADGTTIGVVRTERTDTVCHEAPGTVGAVVGDAAHVATIDEWVLVHRVAIDGSVTAAADVLRPGSALAGPD